MKVQIRYNGSIREADVECIIEPNFGFLPQWRACVKNDTHPIRNDAVDFASLACKRFNSHFAGANYAQRPEDITDHIRNNPYCEVASLIAVTCDWFPESRTIGLAHFRRSWSNNLILDYLVAHPWIASRPQGYANEVAGVGICLMYFIGEIAASNDCGAVWGEATQNSFRFYERVFGLQMVQDLLYIKKQSLDKFVLSLKEKWQRTKE